MEIKQSNSVVKWVGIGFAIVGAVMIVVPVIVFLVIMNSIPFDSVALIGIVIPAFLGLIFFIVGFFMFWSERKKVKNREYLRQNGHRYPAEIRMLTTITRSK